MNLRQQIIVDRTEQLAHLLSVPVNRAFLRLSHSLLTGTSTHTFDDADLVDGGFDKQLDTITIEQGEDDATVYIMQSSNTLSFESNKLIQMHNGLEWLFNKPRSEIATLGNQPLRDKITEYRTIQSELGPSNISIIVAFITNGVESEASSEFQQEVRSIDAQYSNGTFEKFQLLVWGSDELVDKLNAIEKKERRVDSDVVIRYDANNPSLIRYHAAGLKGIVCTASASEIARIVNSNPTGSVFDSNIRPFLGTRGAVNADILATCTDEEVSNLFWFLNNGLTIVCDTFDAVTDPDNPHVKIRNMQIVNGCQTATTLANAEKSETLMQDTRVLLRIYETQDKSLVDRIVLTTNNQNKVSSRDLKSNDPVQIDMEQRFIQYGFLYERKIRQYDSRSDVDAQSIVANELVAQCYLAIVLKKPSNARRRKYKVWGELYSSIFAGKPVEPYIIAILVYRTTQQWLISSGLLTSEDDARRKLANNGVFHIARIACQLWRGGTWPNNAVALAAQVDELKHDASILDQHVQKGFEILREAIQESPQFSREVVEALKAGTLDAEIDRRLYANEGGHNGDAEA